MSLGINTVVSFITFLAGVIFGVSLVLAKAAMLEGLLRRVWRLLPERMRDKLWYFYFYVLPRLLGRIPEMILLKLLDKKDIAIFLEMDYQYSEQLVRLYNKFYTNYVIVWDRLKNNSEVYNLLCNQMKSKIIETLEKNNIDKNNAHIRLSPTISNQRKLELIIINDRQEFGGEIQRKMRMSNSNTENRCIIVPMLTEEVVNYAVNQCFNINKVLIFTILEIPREVQFKAIKEIKNANNKIIYTSIISQKIIKNYYDIKYKG